MRPALVANSGSRGKIQLRYRQRRMASSWSHRHTVLLLIVATMPLGHPDQSPYTPISSHTARFLRRTFFQLPIPVAQPALELTQIPWLFFDTSASPSALAFGFYHLAPPVSPVS